MNRTLIRSTAFVRATRRLVKKQPHIVESLRVTLELLAQDAFDPRLKTHKLKGELAGSWASSAGYDLRIVFELAQYEGVEVILLQTMGTHDVVY